MIDLNKIYCGDSANILKEINNETVDLVVTSPPYSDLRHYGNTLVGWNREKFMEIAVELYRVLKPGGVIVWVVDDKTEKGSETGTSFRQALSFIELDAYEELQDAMNYILNRETASKNNLQFSDKDKITVITFNSDVDKIYDTKYGTDSEENEDILADYEKISADDSIYAGPSLSKADITRTHKLLGREGY